MEIIKSNKTLKLIVKKYLFARFLINKNTLTISKTARIKINSPKNNTPTPGLHGPPLSAPNLSRQKRKATVNR